MKKAAEKEAQFIEKNIADKPLPEKPWRSHMRKEPRKPEPAKEDNKPKTEERAWRANMRKEERPKEPSVPPPKKRHYNAKEVKAYMRAKRAKEKEEQEELEKQETLRKEIIKRRLNELDKLQKEITEADLKEYKRMGQAEKHLSEAGQELLRQKLMELTEQMKSQWKDRQRRNREQDDGSLRSSDEIRLESVYQKSEKNPVSDENNVNLVPQFIDSSRKVSNKESIKLNNESRKKSLSESIPVIPIPQETSTLSISDIPLRPAETLSISEVSDATEIKSLSENPRSDQKTRRRSKQWKDRLGGDLDMTNNVLRVESTCEVGRSANATPLTDEIPERDLSEAPESKSQLLRKIVGEVFSRHQSDLDFIRNTMKDIDLPEEPVITPDWTGSPTKFVPKYPIVITTPPSLPDLAPRPRPVPLPRSRGLLGSQDTLGSEEPPVWMNITKDGSETEFNDLPDGLQQFNPGVTSQNFSIPANLSTTTYAQLPHYPQILASQPPFTSHSLDKISMTNYAEPPAPPSHPGPSVKNASSVQATNWIAPVAGDYEHEADDNLTTTTYAAPPIVDLSSTEDEQPKLARPHQLAAPDQFNFMNTVLRKYELAPDTPTESQAPSDMAISEGALSPSPPRPQSDSSIGSSYAGMVDSKTYSKTKPVAVPAQTSENRRQKSSMRTSSDCLTAETDSESTLKGIDDSIMLNSPRLQEDLVKMKKSMERQQRKLIKKSRKPSQSESLSKSNSKSHSKSADSERVQEVAAAVPTMSSMVSRDIQVSENIQFAPSTVPDALHLRFLTELNQLETVNSTQRLLDELDQIKKSAFDNHKGLEEVQNEMSRQRMEIEEQNNAEKMRVAQKELQDLYSSKLQNLLDNQNEVTKATSDVAKHLATIASGKNLATETSAFSVVNELQKMIENLQTKKETTIPPTPSTRDTTQTSTKSQTLTAPTTESGTQSSTAKTTRTTTATVQTSYSRQESERDSTDGIIPSEIIVDPSSYASKPPSSILELIDQNQAAGSSIQKTISEALASISESDQKTRSNITAEVEEELSTDYSSQFEDESTLKEKSFQAVLPSVSHRRRSMKIAEKKKLIREFSSDASESSLVVTDKENIDLETSSNSLFSDNHSFSKFTLEMVTQYMEEETVRAQHKNSLLKIKEKALVDKAKKEVEELNKFKQECVDKGLDDKMPKIKKKKRTILHKLKERRTEISQMRDNLKTAERQRKVLLQEQRNLLKANPSKKDTTISLSSIEKDAKGDSADQESDAQETEKIAKIEVLKGLKKLDKNKKHLTSKERKLADKKILGACKLFDTSKVDESGSDLNIDESGQVSSRPPSSALECETETSSKSASTSIKTVVSEAKSSTVKSASESENDYTASAIKTKDSHSKSSTIKTAATTTSRHRHSSAESENDSIIHSLADTTMSDQSDIEARIAALSDRLQNRMRTAAKLKKEQKRERKDKLRTQEITLKKQIEKYDQLINEGVAEIAAEKSDQSESFSKPKIKSPKSSISERMSPVYKDDIIGRSSPRSTIVTPDFPSYTSFSIVEEEVKQDSDSSQKTISFDGSTSTIVASPKKGVSPSPGTQIEPAAPSPSLTSASEIIESVSEAIEEVISSTPSSRTVTPVVQQKSSSVVESKYSTSFEQQSPEKSKYSVTPELRSPVKSNKTSNTFESPESSTLDKSQSVISERQVPSKSEFSSSSVQHMSSKSSQEIKLQKQSPNDQQIVQIAKELPVSTIKKVDDDLQKSDPEIGGRSLSISKSLTSSISSNIIEDISDPSKKSETKEKSVHSLIVESKSEHVSADVQKIQESKQKRESVERISETLVDSVTNHIWNQLLDETKSNLTACINQSFEIQSNRKSPLKQTEKSLSGSIATRSKPQDLMLTTFDLTSSSEESPSPVKKYPDTKEVDNDDPEFGLDTDNDFIDDDFGLSAIRQEAEILRLQQIKVEEEIAAIQKGDDLTLGILRTIPDKPPPPYIPPALPKPEKPVPPKVVVPSSKEQVFKVLEKFVKVLHVARENFMDITQVEFTEDLVDIPEDLSESEADSLIQYHKMLYAVTVEKIVDIYSCEQKEQNPPWMQPLPLAKLRFLTPKSVASLTERVQKEVCSDLRLVSKVGKESLLVRWAGKKRDRVDEILVRELQEEEVVWTDYTQDEVVVKDQMTDTIMDSLVQDTADVFSSIYSKLGDKKH